MSFVFLILFYKLHSILIVIEILMYAEYFLMNVLLNLCFYIPSPFSNKVS